jgi:hypothetical protein
LSVRVLITARDAAAALHLIEVVRAAAGHRDLALTIVTQSPATRYFQSAGFEVEALDLPLARERDAAEGRALVSAAREIVARLRPDILLCGLSTPFDGGIDEAVLAVYSGPSLVLQDFWGEANGFFGRKGDLYLALDDEAVRLSRERHNVAARVVGSPRHAAYARLDIRALRAAVRKDLSADSEVTVFGFFGQALHGLEGYRRTLIAWAEAVKRHPTPSMTIYRPHPREKPAEVDRTIALLRDAGLDSTVFAETDVEHALLACDVVCSAFSNCSYDAAYLNHFSDGPLITPVSLFFDAEIVGYFRNMVRLAEFPYLKAGLVIPIRTAADLPRQLAFAAMPEGKRRCWEGARRLPNPAEAPQRVLDAILDRVARTAQA